MRLKYLDYYVYPAASPDRQAADRQITSTLIINQNLIVMRKLTTLCLALLIGLGTAFGVAPQRSHGVLPLKVRNHGVKAPPSMSRAKSATNLPSLGGGAAYFKSMLPSAMMRVGSSGSTVYGWLGYSNSATAALGFTEINVADGSYATPLFDNDQMAVASTFIRQGRVCVYARMVLMGMLMGNEYLEYDMETGNVVKTVELNTEDYSQCVVTAAYDPAKDMIYGYTFNSAGTGYEYFTAPATEPGNFTRMSTQEKCMSLTYDAVNGQLIGVNDSQKLVRIDPETGVMTSLASCPVVNTYISGICYSPIDNAYIWNPSNDNGAWLYKISLPDYKFTKICDYPALEEFLSLMCTDTRAIDAKAPGAATIDNVILGAEPGEDPVAVFFYTIPTTTFDGTEITERMDYTATIDDVYYTDGTVSPGNGGNPFILSYATTEGFHTISLTLSLDGKEGPSVSRRLWVGNDTPKSPENVTLTETGITWDAVSEGVNGGLVDTDALTYTVYMDGKEIASGLTETKYDYTIPAGEIANHRASVVAVCNGHTSEPGLSNGMISGDPMELPVTIAPTADQFTLCTIIDNNKDDRSFIFTQDEQGNDSFCYIFSAQRLGDDYAVMPPMNFPDADAVYRVSVKAACSDPTSPEMMEVYIGDKPEASAMQQCLIERTEVSSKDYTTYTALFTVPASGTYYVAVRNTSKPDSYYMYVRDITVEKTDVSSSAPGVATGLNAVADGEGKLSATVGFTMPKKSISGADLASDTELTAKAITQGGTATCTGKPGEKVSVSVPTVQGENLVTVTVSSTEGEGAPVTTSVWTGIEAPDMVQNLRAVASEDDMTIHLSWEPPVKGVNGGYCPSTGITYYLCDYTEQGWVIGDAIGTDVLKHDIALASNAPQDLYRYGILAENVGGRADYLASISCVAGKPYDVPFTEVFHSDGYEYGPIAIMRPDASYTMQWTVDNPSQLGAGFATPSGGALIGYTSENSVSKGLISASKVSTLGCTNACVTMNFFYGVCSDIEVLVAGYGDDEPVSLGKISDLNKANLSYGYNDIQFNLPAKYQNRKWVQIYIRGEVSGSSQAVIIPTFGVTEQYDDDMEVTLQTPSSLSMDRKNTVKAIIRNNGTKPGKVRSGKWTLTGRYGDVLLVENVAEGGELQPGQTAELTLELTPEADWGQRPKLSFAFDTPDGNPLNDSAESTLWLYIGDKPLVLDLRGVDAGDDYIDLAWTEPTTGMAKASFEGETVGEELPAFLNDFQNLDMDNSIVYGLEEFGHYYPRAAFAVWSISELNAFLGEEVLDKYDGDKFAIAFSPIDDGKGAPDADDWLISPEVKGGSKVSFGVSALSYEYEETLQILYSTTGDTPADFKLLETVKTSEGTWEDVEVTLPEDAKYFALRYVSNDAFAIMIDGISYTPANGGETVVAYDIVRDGEVISAAAKAAGYYRDATIADRNAKYAYNVIPVLGDGSRGMKSNTVYIQASGVNDVTGGSQVVYTTPGTIHLVGFDGQQTAVYGIDGLCRWSGKAAAHNAVSVPAGVYTVKAGKAAYKILVKE